MKLYFTISFYLLITACTSLWASESNNMDNFDLDQTTSVISKPDLIDRILGLPEELIVHTMSMFDDTSLCRLQFITYKREGLSVLIEEIFRQRAQFKELLPLSFPKNTSWKHSYFLRQSFWSLVQNFKTSFDASFQAMDTQSLIRLKSYYVYYSFNAATFFIDAILEQQELDIALQKIPSTSIDHFLRNHLLRNHLPSSGTQAMVRFNRNLSENTKSIDSTALEIGTVLRLSGITEKNTHKYLLDDKESFQIYASFYKLYPSVLEHFIHQAISNPDKEKFILDLIKHRSSKDPMDQTSSNFYHNLKLYNKATRDNESQSQFEIALDYFTVQNLPQDDQEAIKWYIKAADQGYAQAQCNLGFMYYYGRGVPQDNRKAFNWFKKAADQRNAEAQYNLGLMYKEGCGVPQDDQEAVKWYIKAADQGYARGSI